jgi:outer membrane protein assembly factor BamB
MTPRPTRELLYLGVRDTVLAFDLETGQELWNVKLAGSTFTHVVRTGNRLIATNKGEVWCLDAETGTVLWHNPLKGLGLGLISVATGASRDADASGEARDESEIVSVAEHLRRLQAQRSSDG